MPVVDSCVLVMSHEQYHRMLTGDSEGLESLINVTDWIKCNMNHYVVSVVV
jgi:hypothetical protein